MYWLGFLRLSLSPSPPSCLEPDCFTLLFAVQCPVLLFSKHPTPCQMLLVLLCWLRHSLASGEGSFNGTQDRTETNEVATPCSQTV